MKTNNFYTITIQELKELSKYLENTHSGNNGSTIKKQAYFLLNYVNNKIFYMQSEDFTQFEYITNRYK